MINQLKNNWIILLIAAVLTVVGNIVFAQWNNRTDAIHGAASVEYVDEENCKQDEATYIINKRQDEAIKCKVDVREFNELHEDLREIRNQNSEILKILIDK